LKFFPSPTQTRRWAIDGAVLAGAAILVLALIVGLATAADYGITIDEFNTDDYGPKALAWYTSGFSDRSQFETVEFSLWYYGPWFQMLTAFLQSLKLGDHLTVRHATTFVVGLTGIAALLPIARLSAGRWAGPVAVGLCLITGYLYGSLFFTPIDVPFLAAMTWATLAIIAMTRHVVPTWSATLFAGVATGLAIATRTGGIITHAYLIGAMSLCALEVLVLDGRAARPQLLAIAIRSIFVIALAWVIAIVLWPWLQIGNPFTQFKIAFTHFATIATSFRFTHWGKVVTTDALPRTYIPGQWVARLPEAFLALLGIAVFFAVAKTLWFGRIAVARFRKFGPKGLSRPVLLLARGRQILLVWVAVVAPVSFLIIQHATLYDGIRHTLFVIPMLALLAGWALLRLVPYLRRVVVPAMVLSAIYVIALVANLVVLHPLEYIATNAITGGTPGSYDRFELDYWSVAATEALWRLERQLDEAGAFGLHSPTVLICIPYREQLAQPLLHKKWRIELDVKKADFVIETERGRCAEGLKELALMDEVKRYDRAFAWVYVNKTSRFIDVNQH